MEVYICCHKKPQQNALFAQKLCFMCANMGIASGLFTFPTAFTCNMYYFQKHICSIYNSDLSRTNVSHNKCTSWSGTLGGTSQLLKNTVENYNIFKNPLAYLIPIQAFRFIGSLRIRTSTQKWQAPFRVPRVLFTFPFVPFLTLAKLVNAAQRSRIKHI